jgi:glycosyltransferase involved in cell wall biosynthesis
VCYAGNLDGYQDVGQLLRAFARVRLDQPGARLRLVTHPDAHAHAARLAARGLGPGVELVLACSYGEVRAEVARAAVVVSPRTEGSGFPMKLLTYMALGKAIVASAGSAKGLVDGVTASVVPDGDTDAFAAALVALLRDSAARETLGNAARRVVEDIAAWDAGLARLEALHSRLVAPAAVPRGRAGGARQRRVAVTSTE